MIARDHPARPIYLIDTTCRDGEQAPGVAFRPADKLRIVTQLAQAGVGEIELGSAAMADSEGDLFRRIASLRLPSRTTLWCRAIEEDLDAAARCGVDAAHVSVPTSPIHLRALGKDARWVFRRIESIVAAAADRFDYVSVGAQDASRSDEGFLIDLALAAAEAGADRLRLADTVGIWNPLQVRQTVGAVAAAVPSIEVGFHAHNDLGMATANTIEAIRAGATSADVTVNGLGERAGNAPLAQVVMAAKVSMHTDTGVDPLALRPIANTVATAGGRPVQPTAPVIGEAIFRHESGVHVHGMLADARTYEPYAPALTGSAREICIGKHSGSAAMRHVLASQGVHATRGQAVELLPRVRRAAMHNGTVSAATVVELFRSMVAITSEKRPTIITQ